MSARAIVIFPYAGYIAASEGERLFWKIIETAREVDSEPLVVINRDTIARDRADAFIGDSRSAGVERLDTWSVDTSQMWLHGWGFILDRPTPPGRVVLLPGDVERVREERDFFSKLKNLVQVGTSPPDIAIGDFETGDQYSAKELIDTYGTYALLANWFPQVSSAIHRMPLRRPRSEFLNIDADILRDLLLNYRKFAYEQTLNMLIRAWDHDLRDWNYKIAVFPLGEFEDDRSFRQYRGALDQIERTERMLRLLWREINDPKLDGKRSSDERLIKEFSDEYNRLDRVSTGVRENARITIRTLLGI